MPLPQVTQPPAPTVVVTTNTPVPALNPVSINTEAGTCTATPCDYSYTVGA